MRYKITILNVCTVLFMLGLFVYTMIHFDRLSAEEGWGLAAMLGLGGIGLMGGLMDLLIQVLIKSSSTVNIIGSFVAITLAMVILLS